MNIREKLFNGTMGVFTPRTFCFAEADAAEIPGAPETEELILEEEAPEEQDDGLEELEIGPEKYKVPKPIKDGWNGLQKSVQTEKEGLKARAAELDAREARQKETENLRTAFLDEVAGIKGIDKQLEPYLKLTSQDWIAWAEQDSEAAKKAQIAIGALQMERGKLVQTATAKAQEYDAKNKQTAAERQAQAEKDLPAKIKDWSPAKKEALLKVAQETGISPEEIGPLASDWRVMSLLEDAGKYRAAVARANSAKVAAAKAAAGEIPEPEPAPRVRSQSSATTTVPRDSDDGSTWLKKRQAQLAKSGKRW